MDRPRLYGFILQLAIELESKKKESNSASGPLERHEHLEALVSFEEVDGTSGGPWRAGAGLRHDGRPAAPVEAVEPGLEVVVGQLEHRADAVDVAVPLGDGEDDARQLLGASTVVGARGDLGQRPHVVFSFVSPAQLVQRYFEDAARKALADVLPDFGVPSKVAFAKEIGQAVEEAVALAGDLDATQAYRAQSVVELDVAVGGSGS